MKRLLVAAFLAALSSHAFAADPAVQYGGGSPPSGGIDSPLYTSAFAWAPNGNYATLTASSVSSNVALPVGSGVIVVYNTGSVPAYVKLGGASVVATTNLDMVPAGGGIVLNANGNGYLAAITASSTAALNISSGSGSPFAFGGGSGGGGGGGGTVTQGSANSAANAWPFYLVQGGLANAIGNPIYAQITNTVPVSGTVAVTGTFWQATQPVSWSGQTVAATQSGTWTVQPGNTANTTPWLVTSRVVGNGGAVMDFAGQNAASPANSLLVGCQFNTTPTTVTSGNVTPEQCDNLGRRLARIVDASGNQLPAGDAVARGIYMRPTDGTNAQAVKAGSTAAGASDPSAVVALSPNSPLPPGETHVGEVGGNSNDLVSGTVTTTASGSYTNQAVGGFIGLTGNAVRVSGAVGNAGTSGTVKSVVVYVNSPTTFGTSARLGLYSSLPSGSSNCADHTTYTLAFADSSKLIGYVELGQAYSNGATAMFQNLNVGLDYNLSSAQTLYGCLIFVDKTDLPAGTTGNVTYKAVVRRN